MPVLDCIFLVDTLIDEWIIKLERWIWFIIVCINFGKILIILWKLEYPFYFACVLVVFELLGMTAHKSMILNGSWKETVTQCETLTEKHFYTD